MIEVPICHILSPLHVRRRCRVTRHYDRITEHRIYLMIRQRSCANNSIIQVLATFAQLKYQSITIAGAQINA